MASGPKIFVYDVETSPNIGYFWAAKTRFISHDFVIKPWHLMSFAGKWLGEKEVIYESMEHDRDDKRITKRLHSCIDDADFAIAHNGLKFDQKKANSRFWHYKMKPPAPTKMIDTKDMAFRIFGETHNSLQALSERHNEKYVKYDHERFPGISLWIECLNGNPAAWAEMKKYNVFDVLALEELYQGMAPWMPLDFFIYQDTVHCKCGSENYQKRGTVSTRQRKYQRYQCQDCGHWWRGTHLLRSTALTGISR